VRWELNVLYEAAPMPVYGNENSAVNASGRRKFGTAGTRFLRPVSGVILRDCVRNVMMRNALKICALKVNLSL
jgi:hypothetical protein